MRKIIVILACTFAFSTAFAEEEAKDATKPEGHGRLGAIRPGITVTGLGFPTPFRFGAEAKFDGLLGVSADWGFFPRLTISEVSVAMNSWRVAAKLYPMRGSFYVGCGFGSQRFEGTMTDVILTTPVTYNVVVDSTLVVPHVGWRWIWDSGVFFGMEVGVQVPVSSTAVFTSDAPAAVQATPEYQQGKKDVEDRGKFFGEIPLPHFAFVQVGFFL